MVVPPGEVTWSIRAAGCSPVSSTILAAPIIMWQAASSAICRGSPAFRPAEARASRYKKVKAGAAPVIVAKAPIRLSGIHSAWPTAPKISVASSCCRAVTWSFSHRAVTEPPTLAATLGMARMMGQSSPRNPSSAASGLPAARLNTHCPGFLAGRIRSNRFGSAWGFTAMINRSACCATSLSSGRMVTPQRSSNSRLFPSLWSLPRMGVLAKDVSFRIPAMMARAIFPRPINPIIILFYLVCPVPVMMYL